MRSYLSKEEFFKKMKKKPKLKEVIKNIDNFTAEEIDKLSGPAFPKWVREALMKYKQRDGRTAGEVAALCAQLMLERANRNEDL